jgi:imipenem/basic amino acid-specific outer membrane pore
LKHILLVNKDIPNIQLLQDMLPNLHKGAFGRVYNHTESSAATSKLLSVTSGYSYVNSLDQAGEFVNMGTYAIGDSTAGVSVLSATYTGIKGLKLQLWDYYAHDILNALYAEANYGWSYGNGVSPYVGVQWINERDVGDQTMLI